MTLVLIAACLLAAGLLAPFKGWFVGGPLLLFLGLLTLLNAPFDWASLGLTRALLRRGLELGHWWPFLLAMFDAMAAAAIIILLTVVCVVGVQAFDTLAALRGGPDARILPLAPLLDGIETNPTAPEYWWVYAMLLSTMIPSLVNLTIGGTAIFRGVPPLTALLLRHMPDRRPSPSFERAWMALVLTLQVFLGGMLGIAVQGAVGYAMIVWVLPWFGLDCLHVARWTADLNLPGRTLEWLLGTVL